MREPLLVGFAGRAFAGKTTSAIILSNTIRQRKPGVSVLGASMAERLKAAADLLGIRKTEHPDIYRTFCQFVGTDLLRNHDPDWHVSLVRTDLRARCPPSDIPSVVIFDDIRFDNEREFIESQNGILFLVDRPGGPTLPTEESSHSSESSWKRWAHPDEGLPDNQIILNHDNLATLTEQIETVVYPLVKERLHS